MSAYLNIQVFWGASGPNETGASRPGFNIAPHFLLTNLFCRNGTEMCTILSHTNFNLENMRQFI